MKTKQAHIDEQRLSTITSGPLPASRKVYVPGARYPFIRVPLREIRQTLTHQHIPSGIQEIENPAVTVYDTSGPYTDPEVTIDVQEGIAPIRRQWIDQRGDTEELGGVSSHYGRLRLADRELDSLRFSHLRKPLRAKPGRNVTQMHYARKGIITPEMEFIAIRENQRIQGMFGAQHPRETPLAPAPRKK